MVTMTLQGRRIQHHASHQSLPCFHLLHYRLPRFLHMHFVGHKPVYRRLLHTSWHLKDMSTSACARQVQQCSSQ